MNTTNKCRYCPSWFHVVCPSLLCILIIRNVLLFQLTIWNLSSLFCLNNQKREGRELSQSKSVVETTNQMFLCPRKNCKIAKGTVLFKNNMEGKYDAFESPLLALKLAFRAFQFLGIFNFSTGKRCCQFIHRPFLFGYSLLLNLLLVSPPVVLNVLWFNYSDMSLEELSSNLSKHFSKTDFVALVGMAVLLQFASLGFHASNLHLGRHLNSLISSIQVIGILSTATTIKANRKGKKQNPSCKKLFLGTGLVIFLLLSSQFIIGYSFPTMIGISESPVKKLLLGIAQALAVTYLHLPKIFCETLFLRMVHVLEFRYQHLLELGIGRSLDCSNSNKNGFVEHSINLIKLFRAVEMTFCKQLFIQHVLITGSLLCGMYLSTSFIVTSNEARDSSHMTFAIGFLLYSLVPAVRLLVTADSVDKVVVKIHKTRQMLFEMQAITTCPLQHSQVRWAICQYEGIEGFSACNYFVVNRQLVTSIIGYLTTYVIVLMQFKITDLHFF